MDVKKRRPNFTSDEIEVLLQGVEKHSKVKYCWQPGCQIDVLTNTITHYELIANKKVNATKNFNVGAILYINVTQTCRIQTSRL